MRSAGSRRSYIGHALTTTQQGEWEVLCELSANVEGCSSKLRWDLSCCGSSALASRRGTVGNRIFIDPLFTEDANVKNELVLPMMGFLVQPDGTWRTVEFSFEKALYPHRLSVELHDGGIDQHSGGRSIAGWDNVELGLKWQVDKREARICTERRAIHYFTH